MNCEIVVVWFGLGRKQLGWVEENIVVWVRIKPNLLCKFKLNFHMEHKPQSIGGNSCVFHSPHLTSYKDFCTLHCHLSSSFAPVKQNMLVAMLTYTVVFLMRTGLLNLMTLPGFLMSQFYHNTATSQTHHVSKIRHKTRWP